MQNVYSLSAEKMMTKLLDVVWLFTLFTVNEYVYDHTYVDTHTIIDVLSCMVVQVLLKGGNEVVLRAYI